MKPLFLQIHFFDPDTNKEFPPVVDGVEVDVARVKIDPLSLSAEYSDLFRLTPNSKAKIFHVDAPQYRVTPNYYIRVGFSKLNFSIPLGKLLAPNEINLDSLPIYHPSRLPYWDTGWNVGYRINKYFSSKDLRSNTTVEHPLELKVPIRRVYNIGHRGAPYRYPENTIASFKEALKMGANGLELDLCMTKDKKIVIFHDAAAVNLLSLSRTNFENFPFGLISPEIITRDDGVYAVTKRHKDNQYVETKTERLNTMHEYDIVNLTLNQVRQFYCYHCDSQGVEYPIPDLEEFLTFASGESRKKTSRLQFLYFDVKNPGWDEQEERERFVDLGSAIGHTLRMFATLPKRLVIGYTQSDVLQSLKEGIEKTGETRCEFAYDACGSPAAWAESLPKGPLSRLLSLFLPTSSAGSTFLRRLLFSFLGWLLVRLLGKDNNPLEETKIMKNTAISIGCLGRPRSLEEIKQVICDRDYNSSSSLKSIIHYTLNNAAQMYQSLATGVNGVVTDKPDEFGQLLERLGILISWPGEEDDNALREKRG